MGGGRAIAVLIVDAIVVFVEIGRGTIVGVLGSLEFFLVRLHHGRLDILARTRIDWMSDIGVQLGGSAGLILFAMIRKLLAALTTELGAEVILGVTARTVVGELARGHGNEVTVGSLDNLQIADHKVILEGDTAECL